MSENVFAWSITASDNDDADAAIAWPEGMQPGAVNNSARSVMAGVARLRDDIVGAVTTTGSAGSYALTSRSGYTALATDLFISAKASVTNTAGATLNVNTLGAKSIRVFVNGAEAAVAAGQIIIGSRYQFVYDTALNSAAGGWLLLNPSPDPTQLPYVGDIKMWTTDTLPTGSWLWCNGDAVSRTTYAALFTRIGTTYGIGDGSTTFNTPDLRGRAPFGTNGMATAGAGRVTSGLSGIDGNVIGSAGGLETVTLTLAQSPAHTHSGTTSDQDATHTHSGTTGTESAAHSHVIGNQGVPHKFVVDVNGGGTLAATTVGGSWAVVQATNNSTATHTHSVTTGTESQNHKHTMTTDSKGGGALHTNMPPALMVNFVIRHSV